MYDPRASLTASAYTSRRWIGLLVLAIALVSSALLNVHRARPARTTRVHAAPAAQPEPRVTLGRALFFDEDLSEPAGTSCANCHDPTHGYAGSDNVVGTNRGSRPGHYARRTAPSLMYLRFVPRPRMEWDEELERAELFGGFFWDGRGKTIATLVREPLLNPDEMNNRDLHQIAGKVEHAKYADELRREFDSVFTSDEETMQAIGLCLEAFLTSPALAPFSSKYDEFLRGHAALDAREQRGLALFQDFDAGACSACHRLDSHSPLPERSLFTDYGFDAVAVPRNRKLPETRDPQHYDLGLCERRDPRLHTEDAWFCGAFRTPSLRNVALRSRFMHNGFFSSLRDVVSFYATRATNPERWYRGGAFDDLPAKYQENVNVASPPYNQEPGQRPRLDDDDIDAIVAFLGTLSDRELPSAR